MKIRFALFPILLATAHAGPRTSTSYHVATDTTDGGGERSTSASYTNDGSAGGVVGISTVAVPAQTVKHGYTGQLAEVTSLQLAASPTTLNETATRQLSVMETLDDLTTAAVPATSITWSVQSGPLSSISASGLVTAGSVYEDSFASVMGSYDGATDSLDLTVLESIPDNFGTYAGDDLDDVWQVQYFGLNNPNAAPLLDPDFDGQTNLFEYTAGFIPNDRTSRFHWRIEAVPGFPNHKKLIFSPLVLGRTYTVKTSTAVGASMSPLSSFTSSDSGSERTITDTNASGTKQYYTVEIQKN